MICPHETFYTQAQICTHCMYILHCGYNLLNILANIDIIVARCIICVDFLLLYCFTSSMQFDQELYVAWLRAKYAHTTLIWSTEAYYFLMNIDYIWTMSGFDFWWLVRIISVTTSFW